MKIADGYNKLRGGYYTPLKISEFITQWAIRSKEDSILEPSCGDGSFLYSIQGNLLAQGIAVDEVKKLVTGVELDSTEAEKALKYGANVINEDFFTYYKNEIEEKKKFTAIVGNPPFIRYQNFNEEYRKIAFELMERHGFHPNRLTNIWLPFLVLSCKALTQDGRLGMVIPAELFQVDYAAEARLFLSTYFDSLTLITFKRLVFDDIQQEVVLLLGERTSQKKGIRVIELNDLQDLIKTGLSCLDNAEVKTLDHSSEKWVKYYLSNEELDLLARLYADDRIAKATDLYEINVGLVSGENDFFIISQKTVKENHIEDSVIPIIGRSEQVKGIILTAEDYSGLSLAGKKVNFFAPGDVPTEELDINARRYIEWGETQGYDQNYKCRIRKHWYYVSQSWKADAFLLRQANLYPRIVLNTINAYVTDTLHKVRFMDGVNSRAVAVAFLNTYTLALSETLGRSYGGGVLTFEPGEMRKFRIPMIGAEMLDFEKMDAWQREGRYEDILAYTDEILLKKGLGLSEHEVALLHSIWNKMRNRRLSRKSR